MDYVKEYFAIGSNGRWKDNLQDGKLCNVQSAENIVSWIMSNQKIRKKKVLMWGIT
jgi:hypothetical protein